jgi:hypothetical protein
MRKALVFITLIMVTSSTVAWGQARKIVLLEEATNASCTPCSTKNPKLQDFYSKYFGGVVSVRYHAWWPGPDPMYGQGRVDNETRIHYYDIEKVPQYLLDGIPHEFPNDPNIMVSDLIQRLSQPAAAKIVIDSDITSERVKVTVSVIGYETVSQPLFLRSAVIERMITYETPPGTNGETVFPAVMRKCLPNSSGFFISSINPGDSLVYEFDYTIKPVWNWQDLAVVSWLQSDESREIIQSNISIPTYIIESSDPSADVLDLNQIYEKNYWIHNDNPDSLHLRILTEEIHAPAGWSYNLMYDSQPYNSFDVRVAPDDSLKFRLHVQTGSDADYIKLRIFAKNMDDPYGYGFSQSYFGVVPQGDILFVDDDGREEFESVYFSAFHEVGAAFTTIPEFDLLSVAHQLDLSQFKALFWNVSWSFPAFVPDDIDLLKAYLDQGGNLFLAGQDIGWDIFHSSGSSGFAEAREFYTEYMDATYLGDNAQSEGMVGISGDPISDGLSFTFNSIYDLYPDKIGSHSGISVPVLQYSGTNLHGALRYDSGRYRVVYFAFGLEQISNQNTAHLMVQRTLDWFAQGTGIEHDPNMTPHHFELSQNYPNPFNQSTDIEYQIIDSRSPAHISLRIFNVLGQDVRTLVDEQKAAGYHTATWDGRDEMGVEVASGVYFYTILADEFTTAKRMLLLK